MPTVLIAPSLARLPSYKDALRRGYSPSSTRPALREEELAAIAADPAAFVAALDDPEGVGPPVTLPDGSQVSRLPVVARWIWDEGFCGTIGLRWQEGTSELPPHVLGHIGYSVVPWRRNQGHATRALALMLAEAAAYGLPDVQITTTPDNVPSQRVIEANGGRFVGRFEKPPEYGGGEALRYRVPTFPSGRSA